MKFAILPFTRILKAQEKLWIFYIFRQERITFPNQLELDADTKTLCPAVQDTQKHGR